MGILFSSFSRRIWFHDLDPFFFSWIRPIAPSPARNRSGNELKNESGIRAINTFLEFNSFFLDWWIHFAHKILVTSNSSKFRSFSSSLSYKNRDLEKRKIKEIFAIFNGAKKTLTTTNDTIIFLTNFNRGLRTRNECMTFIENVKMKLNRMKVSTLK